MNDEVMAAAAGRLAASHVHCEHFGSALSGGEAFRAFLARSGIEVEVGEDESLLDAIERAGVAAPCLCRGGACGVCATRCWKARPSTATTSCPPPSAPPAA
jgi:ferredoxin